MAKKKNNKNKDGDLVFTTGKEGNAFFDHLQMNLGGEEENAETTDDEKSQMTIRVLKDRKNRRGKTVSLITGLELADDEMEDLAKEIKTKMGTGGSVVDGEIVIQGDFVDRIVKELKNKGYSDTKRSGG